ncbi:MAG: hypothetical protein WA992_06275, partial [Desulfobulbales bacterium]
TYNNHLRTNFAVLIKKLASLLILTSLFVASAASPGMAEIDSILLAKYLFPANKSHLLMLK